MLGRFRPVVSAEMELQLVDHIKCMEGMRFGFTLAQLKRVAFDFTEVNSIDHPFNHTTREAGKDWLSPVIRKVPLLYIYTEVMS